MTHTKSDGVSLLLSVLVKAHVGSSGSPQLWGMSGKGCTLLWFVTVQEDSQQRKQCTGQSPGETTLNVSRGLPPVEFYSPLNSFRLNV